MKRELGTRWHGIIFADPRTREAWAFIREVIIIKLSS
jgi:hypothetical protein